MFHRFAIGLIVTVALAFAQATPNIAGDYEGTLQTFHIVLHLTAAPDGTLKGTVDNTTQNILGVPCADLHLQGQVLSFSVPTYNGKWAGFVGENGALSGMWNQGQPTPLNFTRITPAGPAGATQAPSGPGEVRWDDYIFKIIQPGMMVQAFQGGKMVGTIITVNGQERVMPIPPNDGEKLKKSYDDYVAFTARSHGGAPPPAATAPTQAVAMTTPPQSAVAPTGTTPMPDDTTSAAMDVSGIRFDEGDKSVTVPRSDGSTVTFVGKDVKIGNAKMGRGYLLRYQKGSVLRTIESADAQNSGRAGGGLFGGGVEFLHEGGGLIYDSGMGGHNLQENPQTLKAKQLSQIAVDAVAAVRKVPGHEKFKPPAYDALLEISKYRLRSDGSR
jgi:hypothetical protein